ncbi:alpha/beta fold hydrolase [Aneurinibacillus tyrosinisolvens]|uniref:alpha/beta fold hydrolase n=1 Tax=Aneurinibacillus tyrosinisolvens TaxID=1443435 RepID=UPI00069AB13A|nr:alpha/beta hydrolase [Aneurinibacillus tyrosinisolvens]
MPKVNANNITIEYEVIGDGFPIIFLHGSGVSWRCWSPQIPVFSPHYQMVMPNMCGHGESSPLPRTNNYHELMADDPKLFMDSLGINRAHVIGLSMGAVVALRFAIKYPNYVGKLVSVCGYIEHISNAKITIFNGGFDPLSTERQEIHDEMILDFLANRPIKQYPKVMFTEHELI